MDYTINKTTLLEKMEAEVSEVADQAYAEDGTSLYDAVMLTAKDSDATSGTNVAGSAIDDAVSALVSRLADIASLSGTTLSFDVPDMASSQNAAATAEITRYIALAAATEIFRMRRPSAVEEYAARAQAALVNIESLLRKRTAPGRS